MSSEDEDRLRGKIKVTTRVMAEVTVICFVNGPVYGQRKRYRRALACFPTRVPTVSCWLSLSKRESDTNKGRFGEYKHVHASPAADRGDPGYQGHGKY